MGWQYTIHIRHLNMAASLRAHDLKLTPIEPFRHVPTLPHHHHDLPLIMRLVSNHCGYHTGRVGMYLRVVPATVSGTSYTSCSAQVSGCTWGPPTAYSQTMSLLSKSVYGCPHQHTLLDLLLSSTRPHTPHPPTACGCTCSLCAFAGDCGAFVRPFLA